jgi:Putative adhesin
VRHLALVALLALFSLSARADEWSHSYPVTAKPEVTVNANDGDVEVSVGSSQQVDVRVITRGWKIKDDVQITGNQSGNHVEIKLRKTSNVCFGVCFQSIRVEVRLPRESDLNIHTDDGNVRVENVTGTLQFETGDGDVRLRDVEGSLHADTHDGNVEVNGRFNVLSLHTGDGNIDAEVGAATAPQSGWLLRSGDGNIRLKLADNLGADLDAHTGDGEVNVGFPVTASGVGKENSFRGKINGGGVSIELRTGDGDIKVEKM